MNITGAELIIRFFETLAHQPRPANAVACLSGGSALWPLERALIESTLRRGKVADSGILLFDYHNSLSAAAPVLAQAKAQRRPVVGITSQVRRPLIGTPGHQPADTRRALDPLSKSWFHIGAAMELLELLPEALRLAHSVRRGPVLLEIPEDVLTETIQGAWIPQPARPSPHRNTRAIQARPSLPVPSGHETRISAAETEWQRLSQQMEALQHHG